MTNRYTALIEENPNLTLRQFVLQSARVIDFMYDVEDPNLVPTIPKPGSNRRDELERSKTRKKEYETMSPDAVRAIWESTNETRRLNNLRYIEESKRKDKAYARMRAKVVAWQPPSHLHVHLKELMLEWMDYHPRGESPYQEPELPSPDEYMAMLIELEVENIARCEKGIAVEDAAYRARVLWLEELVASLPEDGD